MTQIKDGNRTITVDIDIERLLMLAEFGAMDSYQYWNDLYIDEARTSNRLATLEKLLQKSQQVSGELDEIREWMRWLENSNKKLEA